MILDELGKFLADNGVGTLHTDITLSVQPEKPDSLVSLIEYGGAEPMRNLDSAIIATERPRVQVICRDAFYDVARTKADTVYKLLASVINMTLTSPQSSAFYRSITPLQSPYDLGEDEKGRERVQFNIHIEKGLSA